MKAWDFEAVYYDCACYCVSCLPDNVDVEDEAVSPIFADSEVDSYPVCEECHAEHDYMSLTSEGVKQRKLSKYANSVRDCADEKTGDLHAYTSLGCYPLYYLDDGGNELCAKCASDHEDRAQITAVGVHWEGSAIICDNCYEDIESAYGNPDEGEGF